MLNYKKGEMVMVTRISQFVRKLTLFFVLALFGLSEILAQGVEAPSLPQLAIMLQSPAYGEAEQGMQLRHPGLRIWFPIAPLGKEDHYLIVPVYVRNPWKTNSLAPAEPIKSFQFSIQYDQRALRAVGVQMIGTRASDTFVVAKHFHVQWDDRPDPKYKTRIPGNTGDPNGRRIRIVGTSSEPLSPTNFSNPNASTRDGFDWAVLLFVKFKVMIQDDGTNTISDVTASNTPLIIAPDTIRWNERDPWEYPFPVSGPDAVPNQPQPDPFGGITNENLLPYNNEPTLKGMAYVRLTRIPKLGFQPNIGQNAIVQEVPGSDGALWELIVPLTLDSASQDPQVVYREVDVVNIVDQSRATDILVQSDQPWLLFQTVGQKNPIPQPTREGYIDYIDEGILGALNDPLGNQTQEDPTLRLRIICDPSRVTGPAGIYVGYISFHSPSLYVSPVRLKVTFIMWRNPIEPNTETLVEEQDVTGRGIRITLESARGAQQSLIFGTGVQASDGVDPLFGEEAVNAQLLPFQARWYPPSTNIGMGDATGRSVSRDIRDAYADTTIIYLCRFKADPEKDYPVVITWDIADFPENSFLYLRDTLNGSIFGTDMRNATHIGGTQYSFTIRDARISSFIIEYTPPRVERLTNIQPGWNLISLPVRPADPFWKTVLPNALDKPRYFFQGAYYQEDNLVFGRGYFVKYGMLIDSIIAGVRVTSVGRETLYKVRLGKGWNTIGALSVPVNVNSIQFDPLNDVAPTPTRISGVYWYKTDEGYKEVSILEPGKGYWVKTDEEGYLRLSATKASGIVNDQRWNILRTSDQVVIRDRQQKIARLYITRETDVASMFELPPLPPAGLFDVRFASGSYVESVNNATIQLQGVDYPVVLSIQNPSQSYRVINPVTGTVLGTIEKGSSEAVVISDPRIKAVQLLSLGTAAGESVDIYPTPAVDVAYVDIATNEAQPVRVELYTILGKKIAAYEYSVGAGVHALKLNIGNLPEGVYVAQISVGEKQYNRRLVIAR